MCGEWSFKLSIHLTWGKSRRYTLVKLLVHSRATFKTQESTQFTPPPQEKKGMLAVCVCPNSHPSTTSCFCCRALQYRLPPPEVRKCFAAIAHEPNGSGHRGAKTGLSSADQLTPVLKEAVRSSPL